MPENLIKSDIIFPVLTAHILHIYISNTHSSSILRLTHTYTPYTVQRTHHHFSVPPSPTQRVIVFNFEYWTQFCMMMIIERLLLYAPRRFLFRRREEEKKNQILKLVRVQVKNMQRACSKHVYHVFNISWRLRHYSCQQRSTTFNNLQRWILHTYWTRKKNARYIPRTDVHGAPYIVRRASFRLMCSVYPVCCIVHILPFKHSKMNITFFSWIFHLFNAHFFSPTY